MNFYNTWSCSKINSLFGGCHDWRTIKLIDLILEFVSSNISLDFHCWSQIVIFNCPRIFNQHDLLWFFQTIALILVCKCDEIIKYKLLKLCIVIKEILSEFFLVFFTVLLSVFWVYYKETNYIISKRFSENPSLSNVFALDIDIL